MGKEAGAMIEGCGVGWLCVWALLLPFCFWALLCQLSQRPLRSLRRTQFSKVGQSEALLHRVVSTFRTAVP